MSHSPKADYRGVPKCGRATRIARSVKQSEKSMQRIVAQYLDTLNVLWLHVPNEGRRSPQHIISLIRAGLKAGAPDILIFTPPPAVKDKRGCAIELKAEGGKLTERQRWWLESLASIGWYCACVDSVTSAIDIISALGYRRV
jgi:hypothetical protein